jgi:hypothetical protein
LNNESIRTRTNNRRIAADVDHKKSGAFLIDLFDQVTECIDLATSTIQEMLLNNHQQWTSHSIDMFAYIAEIGRKIFDVNAEWYR